MQRWRIATTIIVITDIAIVIEAEAGKAEAMVQEEAEVVGTATEDEIKEVTTIADILKELARTLKTVFLSSTEQMQQTGTTSP